MRRYIFLVLIAGCTDGTAGDGREDSFGGNGGKADSGFGACQLAEVLKYVNESTTSVDTLTAASLSNDAASALVAYRNGPDGAAGTGDDEVYDDLDELDRVDFIGQVALGRLVYAVEPRCETDLATRPFIDDQTYAGTGTGGWARDNQEVESVLGVQGLSGKRLRQLLYTKDGRGRTLYDRVRKSSAMEAFTYNFPLDEVPWTSAAQAAREQIPYVSLTIEPDRFAPSPEGVREITLGTDLNDDIYYDTNNYTLLGNEMELRGRARWDTPTAVRRLLIAAKFGTEIDAEGNKTNLKVDIRTDSGSTHLATLDNDVRRGKTAWNGSDSPATPIKGIYEQLAAANKLLQFPAHKDVLLLEPKAHIRSTRSRYHMNESNVDSVRNVYTNGAKRVREAVDAVARARAANEIPAGERATVEAMEAMGVGILDKSLLVARIGAEGVTVTTAELDSWTTARPTTAAALQKNRVIADTIDAVYHEFASALDDADRIITNAGDEDLDILVDQFRAWRVTVDTSLAGKTTYDAFLAAHASISSAADLDAQLTKFNEFGTLQRTINNDDFEDFERFTPTRFAELGRYLAKANLTVSERQIETAGIAGRQLWFDQARELWVPASSRAFSNFMIDTTDLAEMLSHEEWTSIPEADRTFAAPLPATKVFHSVLVNELQIELGMEKAYLDRLRELDAKLLAEPTNADVKAQLEGARFVWGQYTASMKVLTTLKGENILRKLKSAGANQQIKWAAPPDSKGNTALKILADHD